MVSPVGAGGCNSVRRVAGGRECDRTVRIRYDFLTVQKVLGNSDDKTTEVVATKWLNSESINPRF